MNSPRFTLVVIEDSYRRKELQFFTLSGVFAWIDGVAKATAEVKSLWDSQTKAFLDLKTGLVQKGT